MPLADLLVLPMLAGPAAVATYPDPFTSDNRMGVPGELHRISAMRNREGQIIGLTYRIGRHMPGVARLVLDELAGEASSLLSIRGAMGSISVGDESCMVGSRTVLDC